MKAASSDAMVERRHPVVGVGERAETQADREHAITVVGRRMSGRAHDALIEQHPRDVVDTLGLRCHRHHHERTATGFDHLVRALDRCGQQPFGAMHAAELGVEERPFELDAEAARADAVGRLFELVRGFGYFGRRVHHRFPRCRHDRGDEARRAHPRVCTGRDFDRVALVPVEQKLVGAVRMNVDQAGRDDGSGRKTDVAGAVGGKDPGDPAALDR